MSIKLLLVDDHEIVRAGLKAMLHGSDLKIGAEAASGEAALKAVTKHKPDLVLLDIRMKEGDGLVTLGRLRLDHPTLPILMWSAFDNPSYVARAVALGANGYILKSASRDTLMKAIQSAAQGNSIWTREELRRVTGALATPRMNADVEVPLTQRENEVLQKLALGDTNKQIADQLKISYETVKEHVQHILRKIGVTDRTQAAVWAVRKELV